MGITLIDFAVFCVALGLPPILMWIIRPQRIANSALVVIAIFAVGVAILNRAAGWIS